MWDVCQTTDDNDCILL